MIKILWHFSVTNQTDQLSVVLGSPYDPGNPGLSNIAFNNLLKLFINLYDWQFKANYRWQIVTKSHRLEADGFLFYQMNVTATFLWTAGSPASLSINGLLEEVSLGDRTLTGRAPFAWISITLPESILIRRVKAFTYKVEQQSLLWKIH